MAAKGLVEEATVGYESEQFIRASLEEGMASVLPLDRLTVQGARVHNLKGIDVTLPREQLVVITGISGSGKSSLAFDTIYAEGQRRYVESLSPYARQFLDMMDKPEVDLIEGLSPAISIEQKTIGNTPRSTVGTVTEIYDFLRLLFARLGTQYCVTDHVPVVRQNRDQILENLLKLPEGAKISVLAPIVRGRKGHYNDLLKQTLRKGYNRARIDGTIQEIHDAMFLDRYKLHTIEVIVDRLIAGEQVRQRLQASVETALDLAGGTLTAMIEFKDGTTEDRLLSEKYSCPICERSYEEPQPVTFSFNSATNACEVCHGLGEVHDFQQNLVIPDLHISVSEGGIAPFGKERKNWLWAQLKAIFEDAALPLSTPVKELPEPLLDVLINGSGKRKYSVVWQSAKGRKATYPTSFQGALGLLKYWHADTQTDSARKWATEFMASSTCAACEGGRLKPEHLEIRVEGKNIHDIVRMSLSEAVVFFEALEFEGTRKIISEPILREIIPRLKFLLEVGLSYLSLDRAARTLSGGESQRIRLATQIGTQLVGVLYILDEPSIGLHQRDNTRLIQALRRLRDLGNSVIVVEHDKEMMEAADLLVDIGPRAGEYGGELVAFAPPRFFAKGTAVHANGWFVSENSPTAKYLSGELSLEVPKERKVLDFERSIVLCGAKGNNLHDVTLRVPLGSFTCVTGVSGSGKSTLINHTLAPILQRHFYNSPIMPMAYSSIEGLEQIDKVIEIDQSPIGRTPRSNPATYTGLFTMIRDFYAQLPESQIRGYKVGRFSFNVKGGRCEECQGDGMKKIEMTFLPDVYVKCDVCRGRRYNRETLEVHFKGKSIADVLEMSVSEALVFFSEIPRVKRKLSTLNSVGMGYVRLGQSATTLSGGEAQRVKLSTELSKVATGKTLYILDEPTTGLHFDDICQLMNVLLELRSRNNTVVVIEHNLDVVKMADWVIDLGPEGGSGGGYIVDQGTPEHIAESAEQTGSHTGRYLVKELPELKD